MTTRKPGKLAALLLAFVSLLSAAPAAQRAESYGDALARAGDDGIVAYCYGPDWNKRSVRMLETFWLKAATAEAAGNAVMIAVPFYESSESPGADKAADIRGGMAAPPFQVCPAVIMMDKGGRVYATLVGADYLGDEQGELGAKNIAEKLAAFRRQRELMAKAQGLSGEEKARVLLEVSDLPVAAPPGLVEQIEQADPKDKTGALRRNRHSAWDFMHEQMKMDGLGFPQEEGEPIDYEDLRKACNKIIDDEAYRAEDRQAAYNVLIGESRRTRVSGSKLKTYIRQGMKIDKETWYGRLSPTLVEKWGKGGTSSEERREAREARQAEHKNKLERNKQKRKLEHDVQVQ